MKTIRKILFGSGIALLFIAILVVGAMFLVPQQALIGGKTVQFAVPKYTTAECLVSSSTTTTLSESLPSEGKVISCPGEECVVTTNVKTPFTMLGSNGVFFNICLVNEDCKLESTSPQILYEGANMQHNDKLTSFGYNEKMFLQYAETTLFSNKFDEGESGMTYTLTYKPLTLRIEDGLTGFVTTSPGCLLPSDAKALIESNDDTVFTTKGCTGNVCEPKGVANWVSAWVQQEIFDTSLVDYQGETYMCRNGAQAGSGDKLGALWEIGELELDSGEIINYPVKSKIPVECCPNQLMGNFICEDFSFELIEEGTIENVECSGDDGCPGANTVYLTQPDGLTQIKYGCDLTTNKCIALDIKTVECSEVVPCKTGECIAGMCKQGGTPSPTVLEEQEEIECNEAGDIWVEEESFECSFFCELGLSEPLSVKESYCKKDTTTALYIIIGVVFLIALFMILQFAGKPRGGALSAPASRPKIKMRK